ncbi:hypothetical protein Nepgr_014681 [Nepenthes gracilis]|uniref:Uncharacterized protein n=1 Tax=Nepenthes gracilis TaxID=150966 RepID=A0AAD3XQQ3_NEPGR|nr:hypothetical protein Nepgr_014681 [Nepenthes gracilis]
MGRWKRAVDAFASSVEYLPMPGRMPEFAGIELTVPIMPCSGCRSLALRRGYSRIEPHPLFLLTSCGVVYRSLGLKRSWCIADDAVMNFLWANALFVDLPICFVWHCLLDVLPGYPDSISADLVIMGMLPRAGLGSALLMVCCNSVAFAGIQLTLTAPLGPGAVGLNAALAANLLLSLYWVVKFGFCCSIYSHWLV